MLMPQIESSPWFIISFFCILNLFFTWMKVYYL